MRRSSASALLALLAVAALLLAPPAMADADNNGAPPPPPEEADHSPPGTHHNATHHSGGTAAKSGNGDANAPAPSDAGGDAAPTLQSFQAHGILMTLGYVILMPVGILSARFLQTATPTWFPVHWISMILAVACVVPAFAISIQFDALDSMHGQLGCAVAGLTFAQPLIAFVRPHKGLKGRTAWFIAHWVVGMSAVLLGWYNVFKGIELYEVDNGSVATIRSLLAIYIALLAVLYLFASRWDHVMEEEEGHVGRDEPHYPGIAFAMSLLCCGRSSTSYAKASKEFALDLTEPRTGYKSDNV